jgi:hypothetical protein
LGEYGRKYLSWRNFAVDRGQPLYPGERRTLVSAPL